jgi:hypothetical protein
MSVPRYGLQPLCSIGLDVAIDTKFLSSFVIKSPPFGCTGYSGVAAGTANLTPT